MSMTATSQSGPQSGDRPGRIKLLSDEELAGAKADLLKLMDTTKRYLDSELNLLKLANELNISVYQLSYVLNEGFGVNFFNFINRFRVERAKQLLDDPVNDHLNMLAIGCASGFNSKTAFNTTFKKLTRMTPSAYKRRRKL